MDESSRISSPAPPKDHPMTDLKKLTLAAVTAAFAFGTLAACNTVEGIGKDVKKAGEKIEKVATDGD